MADEKAENGQNQGEDEPKTRTRSTQSDKDAQKAQEQSAAEQRKAEAKARADAKAEKDNEAKEKREAERKEREEKREQEKAEREAKRAADKEAKEKEREAEKLAKEQEKIQKRQDQIDSGQIIFATHEGDLVDAADANGEFDGVTYVLTEPKKETVANRARQVIQDLIEEGQVVPVSGKDLAERYEGGTVQWVAFFGMLRVLGYVQPYRFKTGNRGESGLAYKWIGPTDDEFLDRLSANVEGEVEEPAVA